MSEDIDETLLSTSIQDWIIQVVLDDCMYNDLNLEDKKVRDALVIALKSAANFFDSYDQTLH